MASYLGDTFSVPLLKMKSLGFAWQGEMFLFPWNSGRAIEDLS